jgi:hypothetical protein
MRCLISLSLILLAGCGYPITEKATTSLQPHGVGYGGPTKGLTHEPTVVLVGDSVMGAWLTPEVLAANPTWTAQTSAQGVKETTGQILARLPAALALKPQVIVLQAGTWDMDPPVQYDYMCMTVAETTAPTPCANIASMVSEAQNAGIYPIVCTIPPGGPQTSVPGFSTGLNINWFNYDTWAG